MSVSDIDLIHAWKQVLTLSRLDAGQARFHHRLPDDL